MEERLEGRKDGKNLNGWMNGPELNLAGIALTFQQGDN